MLRAHAMAGMVSLYLHVHTVSNWIYGYRRTNNVISSGTYNIAAVPNRCPRYSIQQTLWSANYNRNNRYAVNWCIYPSIRVSFYPPCTYILTIVTWRRGDVHVVMIMWHMKKWQTYDIWREIWQSDTHRSVSFAPLTSSVFFETPSFHNLLYLGRVYNIYLNM